MWFSNSKNFELVINYNSLSDYLDEKRSIIRISFSLLRPNIDRKYRCINVGFATFTIFASNRRRRVQWTGRASLLRIAEIEVIDILPHLDEKQLLCWIQAVSSLSTEANLCNAVRGSFCGSKLFDCLVLQAEWRSPRVPAYQKYFVKMLTWNNSHL